VVNSARRQKSRVCFNLASALQAGRRWLAAGCPGYNICLACLAVGCRLEGRADEDNKLD